MVITSPRLAGTHYITGVRIHHDDEEQHRRDIAEKVNQLVSHHNEVTFDDYLVNGFNLAKGADAPDLAEIRDGLFANAFAGTGVIVEQAFFSVHIRHGYKDDSIPTFHLHWTHNQAVPSGDVKWFIDISISKGYSAGIFPAPTTLSTVQTAAAQYTHHITNDDDMAISATNLEPDTVITGRVYRDPDDAADTFEADAFLLQVDLHYQRDKIGTPERNRPFAEYT